MSDLNKGINTILKFMTFLVVPLCILLILSQIHTVGGWGTALSTANGGKPWFPRSPAWWA